MNIHGKVITLRAMEQEDQELLREMANDAEIEKMIGGYSFLFPKISSKNGLSQILIQQTT